MTENYKSHWLTKELKEIRYNVRELSKATGVSNSKISKYMAGKCALNYRECEQIAMFLTTEPEKVVYYMAKLGAIKAELREKILSLLSDENQTKKFQIYLKNKENKNDSRRI